MEWTAIEEPVHTKLNASLPEPVGPVPKSDNTNGGVSGKGRTVTLAQVAASRMREKHSSARDKLVRGDTNIKNEAADRGPQVGAGTRWG